MCPSISWKEGVSVRVIYDIRTNVTSLLRDDGISSDENTKTYPARIYQNGQLLFLPNFAWGIFDACQVQLVVVGPLFLVLTTIAVTSSTTQPFG